MAATTTKGAPKTITGAGGKMVKIGATCLALNDNGDLTPGTLKGVAQNGKGIFSPKTGRFNGATTTEEVLPAKSIFKEWPLKG